MQEVFQPPVAAEQRARRCIRANHLRVADERIAALVELVKAIRIKFNQNYWTGIGLDADLSEILIGLDDPSNLRTQLALVRGYGAYSDIEVAFLICAKMLCCSLTAASWLGAQVLSRKKGKIAARVREIKFKLRPVSSNQLFTLALE